MAVDEALLLSHTPSAPPTVRFYDWQPSCLSLGRFQRLNETIHSALRTPHSALDIVRRPTGGRAVLHQYEVTYSVVIHKEQLPPESRSVLGSYRWLSNGWVEGLQQLTVQAELSKANVGLHSGTANCFSSTAQCDFLVAGKKLIGAAQCRQRGAILQHGSLLVDLDRALWESLVGGSMHDTVTLKSLGIAATREDIIRALCAGLERTAQMQLERGEMTADESTVAHRLHSDKYTQSSWTEHGDKHQN